MAFCGAANPGGRADTKPGASARMNFPAVLMLVLVFRFFSPIGQGCSQTPPNLRRGRGPGRAISV